MQGVWACVLLSSWFMSLVDEHLPIFDVSDSVAIVINADLTTTWKALMEVDLIEVGKRHPMIAILGALRALPEIVAHLVHGEAPPRAPKRLRLRDTTEIPASAGGWILLGERREDEIALGMVGKLWRPIIEFASVDAAHFRTFREPGFAKTIYALSVRPISTKTTLLTGVMRTQTTDDQARTWFRRYWTLGVGSGAHVLVNGLIDSVREMAEQERPV